MIQMRQRPFWRLAFFAMASAATATAETRTITILHTNDLHARFLPDGNGRGGFARVASALRAERQNCKDCLTLDAGDMVQGSPVSTIFKGVPVYEVINTFGMDVSTLGNHEWDYGWKNIDEFVKTARFDIVNSNAVDEKGNHRTPRWWVVKKVNGIHVAVIGVHMQDLAGKFEPPSLVGQWKMIPVLDAVRKAVKKTRRKADMVVVLAHTYNDEGARILAEIPEVDVVISGHDHGGLNEMVRAGNGVMVRNRGYGVEIGKLSIDFDTKAKKLVNAQWKKIPIDASVPSAPDTAQLIASWESRVAEAIDVVIGEAKRDLDKEGVRTMIEQAMCAATGADLAYMNSGGVRDVIKAGTLRKRNVWNIMPFDNQVVTAKFKGSQLPEAITKRYPVEAEREYTVAVSDFTATTEAANLWKLKFPENGPVLLRDVIIDWITKKKTLE